MDDVTVPSPLRELIYILLEQEYKSHRSFGQNEEDANGNAAWCVETEVAAIIDDWQTEKATKR